jgi:hypothetical protein
MFVITSIEGVSFKAREREKKREREPDWRAYTRASENIIYRAVLKELLSQLFTFLLVKIREILDCA